MVDVFTTAHILLSFCRVNNFDGDSIKDTHALIVRVQAYAIPIKRVINDKTIIVYTSSFAAVDDAKLSHIRTPSHGSAPFFGASLSFTTL